MVDLDFPHGPVSKKGAWEKGKGTYKSRQGFVEKNGAREFLGVQLRCVQQYSISVQELLSNPMSEEPKREEGQSERTRFNHWLEYYPS